jgi:peptidoglycan DL-endopeptidase CwlO
MTQTLRLTCDMELQTHIIHRKIINSFSIFRVALCRFLLCFPFCVIAQTLEPNAVKTGFGKPALIATSNLAGYDKLPDDRKKLIGLAIAVARDSPWLPYTVAGAAPSDGGFDCSGAMYFVMRKAGLDPPRTSAGQLQWLKQNDRLHEVPPGAVALNHPSLKDLNPGDLLFWGRRASVDAGTKEEITHVAMFLGNERKDSLPVMINSTDGRSYRGVRANGYGIYDFRLPSLEGRISFIGYGSPLGIVQMPNR